MKKYQDKSAKWRRIASERIMILFFEAKEMYSFDPKLSDRYVELARRIGMKYKVRLSSNLKRQFCSKCHSFMMPGKNCKIRAHEGKMVYTCHVCKHISRFPYVAEQKALRKKRNEIPNAGFSH
jgi:ribonuclease P protein subunit RPR2